ncbi:MucR family transcriptional regulator (plasmid) [Rhizobium sp. CB3171]|uniref:MucR family transcriptional regulator n=1 Tax=Rhizobium sp. CB3171 TaxID=3039157 RepID=UPI0024B16FDA|nr:MucR family transcriptional regulator [Rhizobium sp. CB3171]WFU07226.1 MucR family transcriptional regulator [Rhizobium sp. CB3171]
MDNARKRALKLTAKIISAYILRNAVPVADISQLIVNTRNAIASCDQSKRSWGHGPAVPIYKSVTDGYIICLEDGKKFKSLKRHLKTKYDLSPEQYRRRWGLPANYPMVAPLYAATRSKLAKNAGFGKQVASERLCKHRS